MKTATSLALVAIGAILAFAITRSPSFLNLQVVGWVLILTGGVGAIMPRRGSGWLRRSVVVKSDDETTETTAPAATTSTTAPVGRARRERPRFNRILMPGGIVTQRRAGDLQTSVNGQVERETIEEYVEE
jgi:hypothetical protein